MRTFFIWLFGLVAAGIAGGVAGQFFQPSDGGFWGLLAGLAGFACFRLWTVRPN